jgi:hypothetical protein
LRWWKVISEGLFEVVSTKYDTYIKGEHLLEISETVIFSDGGAPFGATGVHRTVRLSFVMEMVPSCFLYEAEALMFATDIRTAFYSESWQHG